MKALVFNNQVIQLEAEEFEVHSSLVWIDLAGLDPQPETGWSYLNGNFEAPPGPESDELWATLRKDRDALLASTDWWALTDAAAMTEAQNTYRAALRDLPANTADPAAPVWPVL